jgi:hypothetical protein
VFGLSFVSGLAISRNVGQAVAGYRHRRPAPPVAGPEQVEARLEAFFDELSELIAPGRDVAGLDEAIANLCARVEEWTA